LATERDWDFREATPPGALKSAAGP
jgi:hypothetical protein